MIDKWFKVVFLIGLDNCYMYILLIFWGKELCILYNWIKILFWMILSLYVIYFKGFKKKGLFLRIMGNVIIGESYWYDIKFGKFWGVVIILY